MNTTLRMNAPGAGRAAPADPLRRTASIVGWLFVITYVTAIASKLALYPPLFEDDYKYRTGLVPRRLAALGLIGGPLLILSGSATMLGFIDVGSAWQGLSAAPEFVWELGLGVYLIVKGFGPAADTVGKGETR